MKKMIKIYNAIFLIFPILVAVVLGIVCLINGWERLFDNVDMAYFLIPEIKNIWLGLGILLLIMAFVWIINKLIYTISKKISQKGMRFAFIIGGIFLLTFLSRFTLTYAFREDLIPYSDIKEVWDMAQGIYGWNIDYYTLFPAYMNYSTFMRKIIEIFGANYFVILFLNTIMEAITAIFTGLIGWLITKNERTIIDAGLLYAFLISNIFYVMMGTPDFMAIGFNTIGIYLLMYVVVGKERKKDISLIGAGLFLGIGASLKSFAIIILIAFGMVIFARNLEKKSNLTIKKIVIALLCVVCVISVYKVTKEVLLHNTEKIMNVELDESTATPHYFLIGLNTEGEGQIHIGTLSRLYYDTYLHNGHNVDEAKNYAWEILKKDWSTNYKDLPELFFKKILWAWQSDTIAIWYFDNNLGVNIDSPFEGTVDKAAKNIMPGISQMYYILLLGLVFISGIFVNRENSINYGFEFVSLIIFGYSCLMLLSEAQSRYKCLIFPYICVLAAIGGRKIIKSVSKNLTKTGESRSDE